MEAFCMRNIRRLDGRAVYDKELAELQVERKAVRQALLALEPATNPKHFQFVDAEQSSNSSSNSSSNKSSQNTSESQDMLIGIDNQETWAVQWTTYNNYKPPSLEVLATAAIDWEYVADTSRPFQVRADHVVTAIQAARKTTKPQVVVTKCGPRNKNKLLFAATDVQRMASRYMHLEERVADLKNKIKIVDDTWSDTIQQAEQLADEELQQSNLNKHTFTVQRNGKVETVVVRRKTESVVKPVTKKQLVQIVEDLIQQTHLLLDKRTFMNSLINTSRTINPVVTKTKVVFEREELRPAKSTQVAQTTSSQSNQSNQSSQSNQSNSNAQPVTKATKHPSHNSSHSNAPQRAASSKYSSQAMDNALPRSRSQNIQKL